MSEPGPLPTDAATDPPLLRQTPHPPLPARAPHDVDHYRLYPTAPLPSGTVASGYAAVAENFVEPLAAGRTVLLDGDVGVLWRPLRSGLVAALAKRGLTPSWIDVRDALRSAEEIDALLAPYLPDDPLFGMRYPGELADLFDPERLAALSARLPEEGAAIVFGPGAALLRGAPASGAAPRLAPRPTPHLAYAEVPKNEIQYRARAGSIASLGTAPESPNSDPKEMYRRSYFVDWIVASRHKRELLPELALLIDAQRPGDPAAVGGDDLRAGLAALARRPFRARPWFEPGAWGGQWLKERIPELPREVPNYAWSFELIAPENGVVFEDAEGRLLEVSFDLLMGQESERVLGRHAERFGSDFPIRFDFLDTVDGGNLSLQCHPSPRFIRERFGEPFTQDESYYMLHTEAGSRVYLGFREGIDPAAFRAAVERSARDGTEIDVDRWVQSFPAERHDLFLVPHGTVHCSGAGNVVLEISATPYIFTFKIYDWLRLDLDGKPRPLNIERAFENLDFSRRGAAVADELIARPRPLAAGEGWRIEHLPTHEDHFYDVHRVEFDGAVDLATEGSCHVLSLVEGERMRVEWPGGDERYHYAETVVVPAAVERYRLSSEDGSPLRVVKAFLKQEPR